MVKEILAAMYKNSENNASFGPTIKNFPDLNNQEGPFLQYQGFLFKAKNSEFNEFRSYLDFGF